MSIVELDIESLVIPFKVEFQHSSAKRVATEAILVKATDEHGNAYLGEGCPRSYVTGETIDSAFAFFNRNKNELRPLQGVPALKQWIADNQLEIDENPAAFCAIETSLLKAYASSSNQSIDALLGLPEIAGKFVYSAVIGTSNSKVFEQQMRQYLAMDFNDFKIKLFGEFEVDSENAEITQSLLGEKHRVRMDANNLWVNSSDAIAYIEALKLKLFALEEPVQIGDFETCLEISQALGVKIILDESFNRLQHFELVQSRPDNWIINLRVSKMGGILRSLEIVRRCRLLGISLIIGAQVGETSLLTRSAITVANNCRDLLLSQEGGFGCFLLERDLIDPPLAFGQGGLIHAIDVKS